MSTVIYWMGQGIRGPAKSFQSAQQAQQERALQGAFGGDGTYDLTGPVDGAFLGLGAVALVGIALGLTLRAVASYYAGKAMAPKKADESRYGWYGVVTGTFAGPLGLGVLGGIALSEK